MRTAVKIGFDLGLLLGFAAFAAYLVMELPEPAKLWLAEASKSATMKLLAQLL
ncbi:MAG: hypothetical protein PWQ57_2574 [Desulfovibrionales bacterium]|jgi:hypothetical protein|nr:hypothetical protein [Desulfovibrionales bacterium]